MVFFVLQTQLSVLERQSVPAQQRCHVRSCVCWDLRWDLWEAPASGGLWSHFALSPRSFTISVLVTDWQPDPQL